MNSAASTLKIDLLAYSEFAVAPDQVAPSCDAFQNPDLVFEE